MHAIRDCGTWETANGSGVPEAPAALQTVIRDAHSVVCPAEDERLKILRRKGA